MICSTIHTRVEEDEEEGRPGKEKEREREGGREREDCTLTATLQSARDAQRECNSSLL